MTAATVQTDPLPPMPLSVSTSTPGSFCPDKNSKDAPPPVEICVILDPTPDCATAAAESPPPTIEYAFQSATACAIANVPEANFEFSNTPMGPFHTIVFACRMMLEYRRMVSGPISKPICSPGVSVME